jgi:proline dehydrogenase
MMVAGQPRSFVASAAAAAPASAASASAVVMPAAPSLVVPPFSSSPSSAPGQHSQQQQQQQPELDFDDVSQSFAVKSEAELWRGLLVFKLCAVRPLVTNARLLLNVGEKMLGRRLMHAILRQTFFGHFCAGETDEEVARVVARLEKSGIGGILDYAAEADVAAVQPAAAVEDSDAHRDRTGILSARTYDYAGEAECDANARICESCIVAAGAKGDGQGFAAIKLTALGKPELLEHLSKILTETKRLFVAFADGEIKAQQVGANTVTDVTAAAAAASAHPSPATGATASSSSHSSSSSPPSSSSSIAKAAATAETGSDSTSLAAALRSKSLPPNPHPSIPLTRTLSFDQFVRGLAAINVHLDSARARRVFDLMDKDKSGGIDYLEWVSFLDPQLLGGLAPKFRSEGLPTLGQDELDKVHAMLRRLERLAELAAKKKVKLMVDAEQTYFQPAIDHLVLHLQRKYNSKPSTTQGGKSIPSEPVIFNTYQCYLRDSHARVLLDLERSRREGFTFAAKIVRGAYMVQERKRAKDMDYQDPIMPNLQATHDKSVTTTKTHTTRAPWGKRAACVLAFCFCSATPSSFFYCAHRTMRYCCLISVPPRPVFLATTPSWQPCCARVPMHRCSWPRITRPRCASSHRL